MPWLFSDFLCFGMSLLLLTVTLRGVSNKHCLLSFLAHLSQRLIGELIGYSWSGVRPSASVVNNFKRLLLQNRLPDQCQILCGASLGRGNESFSCHLGHMTKMAATPIYGKNPSKIFSRTGGPIFTKLGM